MSTKVEDGILARFFLRDICMEGYLVPGGGDESSGRVRRKVMDIF